MSKIYLRKMAGATRPGQLTELLQVVDQVAAKGHSCELVLKELRHIL